MAYDLAKMMKKNLEKIKKESRKDTALADIALEKLPAGYKTNPRRRERATYRDDLPQGLPIVDEISKSFKDNFLPSIKSLEETELNTEKVKIVLNKMKDAISEATNRALGMNFKELSIELMCAQKNRKCETVRDVNIGLSAGRSFGLKTDKDGVPIGFSLEVPISFSQIFFKEGRDSSVDSVKRDFAMQYSYLSKQYKDLNFNLKDVNPNIIYGNPEHLGGNVYERNIKINLILHFESKSIPGSENLDWYGI